MKEESLSDKRRELKAKDGGEGWGYVDTDVKEAVKKLVEFLENIYPVQDPVIIGKYGIKYYPVRAIKEIFGEKLI